MALTFGYQNVLSDEIYDPSGTKNMGSVSHLWIGLAGVRLGLDNLILQLAHQHRLFLREGFN